MGLADSGLGVGCMMKHAVRIKNVECVIGKGQAFRIAEGKIAAHFVKVKMVSRYLDRTWREINTRNQRAAACELEQVGSHSAADFEQALVGEFVKTHHLAHPRRILFVTVAFNLVKKLACTKFLLAAINRAAWIAEPL